MKHYSLMICDDEQPILNALTQAIDWEAEGFHLTHASTDPHSILAHLDEGVDLLISDIRMAGMSGLELVEALLGKSPSTNLILISGYPEFEYAREAIRLGVRAYILKPIDTDELLAAVRECKRALDAGRRQEQEQILMDLLRDPDPERLERLIAPLRQPVVAVGNGAPLTRGGLRPGIYQSRLTAGTWLTLLPERELLTLRLSTVEGLLGLGLRIVDKQALDYPRLVAEAYRLSWSYYNRPGVVVASELADVDAVQSFRYHVARLRMTTGQVRAESAGLRRTLEMVRESFAELEALQGAVGVRELYALYQLVHPEEGAALSFGELEEALMVTGEDPYAHMVTRYPAVAALFAEGRARAEEQVLARFRSAERTPVDALKDEILHRLHEGWRSGVELQGLSDSLGYSASYVSDLIREATGEGFSDYLTRLRMEEAVSLLRRSELTVNEVAERSGYQDPAYFRRVFRKRFGITPSEYRARGG